MGGFLTVFLNPYTILAIVVVSGLSYAGGYFSGWSHQRAKIKALEGEITSWSVTYNNKVTADNKKFEELQQASNDANKSLGDALHRFNEELGKKDADLQKQIKENKRLNSIIVDLRDVQLLNASTQGTNSDDSKDQSGSTSVSGVKQEASGSETNPGAANQPTGVALSVIFSTVAENNANHLACVAQVEALQKAYNAVRDQFEPR